MFSIFSPLYNQCAYQKSPASEIPAWRLVSVANRRMDPKEKARKTDPDGDLVKRAQAGDTEAFDQLILNYGPKLHSLVYNMTSNREDTHDILQEVFSKAYRSIRRFRGHSTFYTWVYSIAVNMTLNHLKKRGRVHKMSLEELNEGGLKEVEALSLTCKSNPIREVDIRELQQRLNDAMMALSEDHRTVVTLFDIQGLPHAEISKILGVSQGTVRSRLFYAHRQLQNFLHEFLG